MNEELRKRILDIQSLTPLELKALTPVNQKRGEEIVRSYPQLINKNDGRIAIFPVNTVGKILRHKGYDISRIIKSLPGLYETSLLGWSEPEILKEGHISHQNIKAYHHYINKFYDESGEYYIRFAVTEANVKPGKIGKNLIHSTSISNIAINKNGESFDRVRLRRPGVKNSSPFIDIRLRDFFDSVK